MRPSSGSLIMTGLPGFSLDDSSRQLIAEHGVNHFILFRRNVDSPEQVAALCGQIVDCCRENGLVEPLIAIDQEGGTVSRLPPPFEQFADAREYGDHPRAEERLADFARLCAADLRACGINMNFAPVLDVCPRGRGAFMERRALGSEPARVAALGEVVIHGLQQRGIAACGKHFPGLGQGKIDPHLHLPIVTKSARELEKEDLPPFLQAMGAAVAAIMTSHVLYSELDKENLATMSHTILTKLLRERCAFTGLVVTDDLEMGAIENDVSVPEAALRAALAGADLLLICHDHDKVRQTIALLDEACRDGVMTEQRVAGAVARIVQVSERYGRKKS